MLGDRVPVSFVLTTDAARARAFYEGVLGLAFVEETPFAVVLRSGPATVRVTPVEAHQPAGATVLGWEVDDLGAAVDELTSRGVAVLRYGWMEQDERGIWASPGGTRVAWFADPDGNVLSLSQP